MQALKITMGKRSTRKHSAPILKISRSDLRMFGLTGELELQNEKRFVLIKVAENPRAGWPKAFADADGEEFDDVWIWE